MDIEKCLIPALTMGTLSDNLPTRKGGGVTAALGRLPLRSIFLRPVEQVLAKLALFPVFEAAFA